MVLSIMKQRRFWILTGCLALLLGSLSVALGFGSKVPSRDVSGRMERIEFSVNWSFIPLFKTYMETHRLGSGEDPIFYRLTHQAASNAFWNDHMASIIDPESLLPTRVETIVREGKELSKQSIVFDRHAGKALFSYQKPQTGRAVLASMDITEKSMDPLSAFYTIRKRLSPENPALELSGIMGSRRFVMRGRLAAQERIRVRAGTFETYRLECHLVYWPQGGEDDADQTRVEGNDARRKMTPFTLWVSQDEDRFPIQIRYDLPLGSLWVKATFLQSYDLHRTLIGHSS
jgi:hypothetical protein